MHSSPATDSANLAPEQQDNWGIAETAKSIKPYIFIALLPGTILWGLWERIQRIRNTIIRITMAPLILGGGFGGGISLWTAISPDLGRYSSIDSMVEKAHVSYTDLKRDYYQGNSFDLGDYDQSVEGMLSKFPEACFTGLFRPFIWESNNIVMAISGIENLFLLMLVGYAIVGSPIRFIRSFVSNPIVFYCLSFAVIFAFSIAISTTNFGALVRFKLPLIPFLVCGLFIVIGTRAHSGSGRMNRQ